MKLGILAVSFGTTHLDTLEKTIRAAETDLSAAFPGACVYRAFTSGMVRGRLKSKYDIHVDSVAEALERMRGDGVEQAVVQTTLLIPGEEFDLLRREVLAHAGPVKTALGLPLLWDDSDFEAMIDLLERTYPVQKDQVLLLMGHGTSHGANDLYLRLAQRMAARGEQMALCTVEGTPTFEDAIRALKAQPRRSVRIAPLLLVAGDHVKNDMAGDGPDSLRCRLEAEGFQVSCDVRGLGEIAAVRERLVCRARAACDALRTESGCGV